MTSIDSIKSLLRSNNITATGLRHLDTTDPGARFPSRLHEIIRHSLNQGLMKVNFVLEDAIIGLDCTHRLRGGYVVWKYRYCHKAEAFTASLMLNPDLGKNIHTVVTERMRRDFLDRLKR